MSRFRIAPLFNSSSAGMQELLSGFIDRGYDEGLRLVTNYLHPYFGGVMPATRVTADGVLIFMGGLEDQRRYLDWGLATVNFSASSVQPVVPSVWPDNVEMGRLAGEHLLDIGLRHFAWFGNCTAGYARDRRLGFQQAVDERALSFHDLESLTRSLLQQDWETITRLMVDGLKQLPGPIGIACVDDAAGLMVLQMAQEAGLSVPDDMSVIGFNDDEQLVVFSDPPMTSVRWNFRALGQRAAEVMLQQLHGTPCDTLPVRVGGAEVIARASTRAIAVDDGELAAALRFIRMECVHRSLRAEDICEVLPVSRKTLDRRMKEHLGRTVAEEIRRVRAGYLRDHLRDTDWPLKRIASEMGFASADELGRWCQHHMGMKPAELREHGSR